MSSDYERYFVKLTESLPEGTELLFERYEGGTAQLLTRLEWDRTWGPPTECEPR